MTANAPATLAEALHQLQADPPAIVKAERAEAGKFSYSFAGLSRVTEAVLPVLNALGCIWICRPTRASDGFPVVAYELRHVASGEALVGEYPMHLPSNATPQMAGSMISYARRYALLALLGIAPEADDDDAAAASRQAYGEAGEPTRTARPRKVSKAQVVAIQIGFSELGLGGDENRATRLTIAARLAGVDELRTTNDLTGEQAKRVLDGIARKRQQQAAAEEAGESGA